MKYVLDSSVAVKWVLDERDSHIARRLRDDFRNAVHELIAPDIFAGEVAHALTKAERKKAIQPGEAAFLWPSIMATRPLLVPYLSLIPDAIAISSQTQAGAFDCIYVALARQESCGLVTADQRLLSLQPRFPFILPLASFP